MRKAWIFVMVLAFSRLMVVRVVFDQKIETWLRCHAEAFAQLGGVPKVIVPDNLKAAVIRASFAVDGGTVLNLSYREFARFYAFQVDPTPVRAPKKKGKVESAVKYIKNNFFTARKDKLTSKSSAPSSAIGSTRSPTTASTESCSDDAPSASRSSASTCCRY